MFFDTHFARKEIDFGTFDTSDKNLEELQLFGPGGLQCGIFFRMQPQIQEDGLIACE
jgi:hypothetical protein